MATVYDLLNPSGTVAEESRIIRAPGATTGDVLTVNADKTIAPAPGGGSSALSVVGPYPLLYTDLPHEDDTHTLFTPTAGTIILNAWVNPRTFVPFVSENSSEQILVGHASEFDPSGPTGYVLRWDSDLIFDNVRAATRNIAQGPYPADLVPSFTLGIAPFVTLAEPIIALYYDAGDNVDLTQGSADIYFAIATATAP